MAKRKSINKRLSKYSRGSGGSNVLNPDTTIFGDEYPYWWRNLENDTTNRLTNDSTNFNQTSRRLNSNSSIRTSNNRDNDWWKVLEGTPRNLKSLESDNDLSRKDGKAGTSAMSESEEEVKIAKKKPPLPSKAKKVDSNAFLSALNDLKVSLVPLEKDPAILNSSFAEKSLSIGGTGKVSQRPNKNSDAESSSKQENRNANAFEGDKLAMPAKRKSSRKLLPAKKRFSVAANSPVIAAQTDSSKSQNSIIANDYDLTNCPPPKASSTLLENSIVSRQTSTEGSNSDIEPIIMKQKSKLLRRRNRDTKKNPFENILMEDKIDEDAEQSLFDAGAAVVENTKELEPRIEVDESPEEPKLRIFEDESKYSDADASKKLHSSGKTDLQNSTNDFSDTDYVFLEPTKPKSRFLRETRRSRSVDLFQRILEDSDSSITKATLKLSNKDGSTPENKKSMQNSRRGSTISEKSNVLSEEMNLRLSTSSNASDVDIIRTDNDTISRLPNSNTEIPSSQPAVSRPVLPNNNEKSRNVSCEKRTQELVEDFDEEKSDGDSDVTLIIPASNDFDRRRAQSVSKSPSTSSESKISRNTVPMHWKISPTTQRWKNSTAEEAVKSLKNSLIESQDSPAGNNVDDASDIEFLDSNGSRKRSVSRNSRAIAAKDAALSQRSMMSQDDDRLGSAISNEEKTEHDEETASRRSHGTGVHGKGSISRAESVSETEHSTRTSEVASRTRSITARQWTSNTANDEKTREFENATPKRNLRSGATRRSSETENVRTPERKSGKVQEQTPATAATENDPMQAEKIPRKSSQRPSKIRKEASTILDGESEAEGDQFPASSQSKIRETTTADGPENTAPRPSQRSSGSRKEPRSRGVVESEVEVEQSPSRRRSGRTSKVPESTTPDEPENTASRPSQKLSESRKATRSNVIVDSEVEFEQSPSKRRSARTSKVPESTTPDEPENTASRPSQKLSESRKATRSNVIVDSEVEVQQSPSRKQSGRTSKFRESTTPDKPEDTAPIPTQRPSKSRKATRSNVIVDSEEEVEQSPSRNRSGRTDEIREPEALIEPANISQKPSQRPSKSRKELRSRVAVESEVEVEQSPSRKQSGRTSKVPEPTIPDEPENTAPIPTQRPSKSRKATRSNVIVDSEEEVEQSPSRNRSGRTDEIREPEALIEPANISQKPSQRPSKSRIETRSRVAVESEVEVEQSPSRKRSGRTSKVPEPTTPDGPENTAPRTSQKPSESRKATRSNFVIESEEEVEQSPWKKHSGRTSEIREPEALIELVNISQKPSKSRKETRSRVAVESEVEVEQSPSRKRSGRTSKVPESTTPTEPENVAPRSGKRLSDSRRETRTNVVVESEVEVEQSPSKKRRGVTSETKLSSGVSRSENMESPVKDQNEERADIPEKRKITEVDPASAESTDLSESQWHIFTKLNSGNESSNSSDDEEPTKTKQTAQNRSQRQNSVRRAESLPVINVSEAKNVSSTLKNQTERSAKRTLPSTDDSGMDSFLRMFLELSPTNTSVESERSSTLVKEKDVDGAVRSSSVPATSKAETDANRDARSRGSRSRSKLFRDDRLEETEEEDKVDEVDEVDEEDDEKTEADSSLLISSIAKDLEPTSSKHFATQRRSETVSNRGKQSFESRERSGSNVEEDVEAKTRGELEKRSTKQSLSTPKKKSGVSIKSITKVNVPIENLSFGSPTRVATDRNATKPVVGLPSGEQSGPGTSGRTGSSLRPLSLNRIETESERGSTGEKGKRNDSKIVLGRKSNVAAGSGRRKSSAAPRVSEKKVQRNIEDFFKSEGVATPASQGLSNVETVREIRKKLEEIKKLEIERAKEIRNTAGAGEKKKLGKLFRPRQKQQTPVPKKVHKAYLVNGLVYKQPRLPRPARWVTDRLYKHLWKCMEPKYKLETRLRSEKFILRLSEVVAVIAKSKTYQTYKTELHTLMKEMARLQIVHSRHDFYNFCYDFLPYELRSKMVPILMPGNENNMPFDPEKLHEPLLSP